MSSPGSGGNVVEAVITAMELDATNYVANAQKVIDADKKMIASANALAAAYRAVAAARSAAGGGAGSVPPRYAAGSVPPVVNPPSGGGSSSGSGGGSFAGIGGAYLAIRAARELMHVFEELGHKMIEISSDALKQYAEFDTLSKSLQGIYGSSSSANQALTYLRDTAMHSAFHFKDLADAARGIAVAGLDVNRWLPITQGFSLAMGNRTGEGLQEFIGILRRLQGGNTGLALGPRGIGRYGVSRAELEAQGATFDAHGHFTGSINQAFDAIEKVFQNRIKGIADQVKKSFEVTLSNAGDAIQQATIDFGHGLANGLTAPIEAATDALNGLRQAGVLIDFGDAISNILTRGGFEKPEDPRYNFKDKSGVFDQKAYDDYRKKRFDVGQSVDDNGNPIGGSRVPHSTGNPLQDIMIHIGGYIVQLVELGKEEVEGFQEVIKILSFGLGGIDTGNIAKAGRDFEEAAFARSMLDWQDRVKHPEKYGSPAPQTPGIPGVDDDATPAGNARRARAARSRQRRDDFRRTAFGGGDIGSYGITPVELGQISHGMRHATTIKNVMADTGDALSRIVQQIIREELFNAMRQNYLRGGAMV